ncbi:uncharacterized protein LOC106674215 [Cimex lectularius]|uniref:Uncharacterized protein n=1 Tax=Cimex lectularius TaxID=79782 RepID=A0A8I6SDA4_CIMLE|nr:uncharacterized protein LOC106674215 [Cimex lectularius]
MAEETENPSVNIRVKLRSNAAQERIKRRQELFDMHRDLSSKFQLQKSYGESDVVKAAACIVGHGKDKEDAFAVLKAAFIQDESLIVAFMKIEGALHSLVGYLLSRNSYEQLLATECCCNLSLGDGKTCYKLAKAATPYLITILQGCNYKLMDVAIETLSNLAGTGEKTSRLLYSQGILEAFQRTIKFPELGELTAKALVMLTKSLKMTLKDDEVLAVVNSVHPYFVSSVHVQWLLYHLSSVKYIIPKLLEKEIPGTIIYNLDKLESLCSKNIMSVTAQVRTLGNLSIDANGYTANVILDNWEIMLKTMRIFMNSSYKHLCKELFWVLGTMLRHDSPDVQQKLITRARDLQWLNVYTFHSAAPRI